MMDYQYGAIRVSGEPGAIGAVIARSKLFNGTSVKEYMNYGDKVSASIVAHMNDLGSLGETCRDAGAYYKAVLPMINYQQVENSMW